MIRDYQSLIRVRWRQDLLATIKASRLYLKKISRPNHIHIWNWIRVNWWDKRKLRKFVKISYFLFNSQIIGEIRVRVDFRVGVGNGVRTRVEFLLAVVLIDLFVYWFLFQVFFFGIRHVCDKLNNGLSLLPILIILFI